MPMDDRSSRSNDTPERANQASARTPQWVKVFAIATVALVVLAAVIMLAGKDGQHGPGRHTQSAGIEDGYAPPARALVPAGQR
jgi:hypothetical protein